ncbi:MAG: cytochrome c3 family protein [Opitutaceae bacterium]|nr:cytochrome c3 family protein [Opitutaceae bacterium]
MTQHTHRYRNALTFGGIALWGAFLVSCVVANRTMVAPPRIAGAEFVGSGDCVQCHEDVTSTFHDATHAKLVATDGSDKAIGCESCHGPGSIHSKTGGEVGTIINPERNPETCFQCHLDKRGEFSLPHVHPVGKVGCSDCHDPHRGDAIIGGGTNLASANDTCLKCHESQRGPFVFEHEALRESCVTCHNPHGTVNDKMLKARNQTLCLQCHYQQQTVTGQLLIGGRDHAAFVQRGTCWTAGCHEAVHGSHVNSSLRF